VNAGLISFKNGTYIYVKLKISGGINEIKPKYFITEVIDGLVHNEPDQLTLNEV